LIVYLPPGRIGSSAIQHTIASTSWLTAGWLCGRQIMSPREMSISSSSRIVTDMGANASATGPSTVSMAAMRDGSPDGSTITSSPGLKMPPATWPA
jgi:hypothetical protein